MGSSQSKKIDDKTHTNEKILTDINRLFNSSENKSAQSVHYTYNLGSLSSEGGSNQTRNRYSEIKARLNKKIDSMQHQQINQTGGADALTTLGLSSDSCQQFGGCGCNTPTPIIVPPQKIGNFTTSLNMKDSALIGGCGCNKPTPIIVPPPKIGNFTTSLNMRDSALIGGCDACGVPNVKSNVKSSMRSNTSSANMSVIRQLGGNCSSTSNTYCSETSPPQQLGGCDACGTSNIKSNMKSNTSTANVSELKKQLGGDCSTTSDLKCVGLSTTSGSSRLLSQFMVGGANSSEEMNIMPFYTSMSGTEYYNNVKKDQRYK